MDWEGLSSLDETEIRARLAPFAERFAEPDGIFGAEVDMEVLAYGGGRVLPAGTYPELVLPRGAETIVVDGDLELEGVLEQPFQSAVLFVTGNLRARHVVTTGCMVVMGNVTLAGVFYGNCTNYCTHVFGTFRAQEIVLEKNHHFAMRGETTSEVRLEDEEDGYEATEAWMNARGVDAHDEHALAAALRSS